MGLDPDLLATCSLVTMVTLARLPWGPEIWGNLLIFTGGGGGGIWVKTERKNKNSFGETWVYFSSAIEFNGLICCLCLTAKITGTKGYPFSCKAMSLSRSFKVCNRRAVLTGSYSSRKGVTAALLQPWQQRNLPHATCDSFSSASSAVCNHLPQLPTVMTYRRGGGLAGP